MLPDAAASAAASDAEAVSAAVGGLEYECVVYVDVDADMRVMQDVALVDCRCAVYLGGSLVL